MTLDASATVGATSVVDGDGLGVGLDDAPGLGEAVGEADGLGEGDGDALGAAGELDSARIVKVVKAGAALTLDSTTEDPPGAIVSSLTNASSSFTTTLPL
jgi:hypothetical protein